MTINDFDVLVATKEHSIHVETICNEMAESAKARGTGIAKRSPDYIEGKIDQGKAVIALTKDGQWAGFSYIESWGHDDFVANSGLIIAPSFRKLGLAKAIKIKTFELSRKKFPGAKLFGLTTGLAVMKINSDIGYRPVTFSELTNDEAFWKGCESCVNFDILQMKERKNCLCTAMIFDPSIDKTKYAQPAKKVVLAFSGGLDTSYAAIYLSKELGLEVHAVLANTGGFSDSELAKIEQRANDLGVASYKCLDVSQRYYNETIKYMIFGNVLKNGTYPISVSSERISQAASIAEYAVELGADFLCHGSTGAGNDQVRFDMIFNYIAPKIDVIALIREKKLTRQEEIDYLRKHGVNFDFKKAEYSINQGIWGTSVGGKETLTSNTTLPESAYPSQLTATEPTTIRLTFAKGEMVGIDGVVFEDKIKAIQHLQAIASPYAIGRDMHIGDTIIGIKGRVGFEAAAPILIIKAHHMLEKHTLGKWQLFWKDQISAFYGNYLHEGQYYDPVMRDIEAMLSSSQATVSGDVIIELHPYRFVMVGVESKHDLMSSKFGAYGEVMDGWSGDDVKGFGKIFNNQNIIHKAVNEED